MKRDIELVRRILLSVEAMGPNDEWEMQLPDVDEHVLGYHVGLLADGGYVTAQSGTIHDLVPWVTGLTWAGHDFLDSIRDDKVWKDTTKRIASTVGTAAVDVVKQVAIFFAKQHIGMP